MKIAVLTSGGDAPGMNAAIRAVVRAGIAAGHEVYGMKCGYSALFSGAKKDISKLTANSVANKLLRGGTFLHSARETRMMTDKGRDKAAKTFNDLGIDCLVAIGGDGTYAGALELHKRGIKTVCIPATIDNDLQYTDWTIGFDTALHHATGEMSRIRDTMNSHLRVCFVEIMGRHCGDLTLYAGLAAGAEAVLLPEPGYEMNVDHLVQRLLCNPKRGHEGGVVAVAEGVRLEQGVIRACDIAPDKRPPGAAKEISDAVDAACKGKLETRHMVLGHTQRGGDPTARDIVLASQLGDYAVSVLNKGGSGLAVGIRGGQGYEVDIAAATCKKNPDRAPSRCDDIRRALYETANRLTGAKC
ncbi:MAG: 6-phosphofructokinase [Clostridia bacterium]|nr:6-phosphofructokinase [Clostridia bacterium]